ncbi:MAG: amidohydrolase [FCB group bacterium]|nr:amidohydrolase [FCB group bacterium]
MNLNIRPDVVIIQDAIINTRRDLHQHPELGFREFRTAKLVADKLTALGLEVQTEIGRTGVVGLLEGRGFGPTIALRADMDALPMQETGNPPYKSMNPGVMHACGHDGHTAMLLGAAEVLTGIKDRIHGKIKFVFQPAEEGQGGARVMIEEGVLEDVDEIYGIHLWNYQKFGTIGVKSGPILASADIINIVIEGTGGHGAAPQGTVDAIVVAAQLINILQTIVSRNTNPLESTVVTIGKIQGGSNFNIIADKVVLNGTTRAYTEENRQLIKTRLQEIVDGVAATHKAEIKLKYFEGYPPTVNNAELTQKVMTAAEKIVGTGAGLPFLSMGGEDFSYYAQKIPGCFFFVGSAPESEEPGSVPHHCSHFDIEEQALLVGCSVYVQLIEDLLIK